MAMEALNGSEQRWIHTENRGGGTGFFTQLTATMRRQVIQKRRMWGGCLLEFCLPILFVLGLFAISLVSTREDVPAKQYIGEYGPWDVSADLRNTMLCYDPATAHDDLKALLKPCSGTGTITCLPTTRDLPLPGLCIIGSPSAAYNFAMALVNNQRDVEVPNYDDYILFKWMACAVIAPPANLFVSQTANARQAGKLFITPNTGAGPAFADYMNSTFILFKHSFGGYFTNRDAALPFAKDVSTEGEMWAVMSVDEASADPSKGLSYTLSMNTTAQANIRNGIRDTTSYGLKGKTYAIYTVSGALTLQKSIQDYYLVGVLNTTTTQPAASDSRIVISPMPIDAYTKNTFLQIGGAMGPLLLVLAFLYPVSQLAKRLVEEKEQRLREGTMIMGLTKAAFFSSWLIVYYCQMFFAALFVSLVQHLAITSETNFGVTFLMYLLFTVATINMAAMFATFFSKAKVAALVVPLLYFVVSIPVFAIPDGTHPAAYHSLSIFCPTALAVALRLQFGYQANRGIGVGGFNNELDIPYSFMYAILWTIGDAFLYVALMLYFDTIIPKEWGTTRHPLFFLRRRAAGGIWPDSSKKRKGDKSGTLSDEENEMDQLAEIDCPVNYMRNDAIHANRRCAIQDYPSVNSDATVSIYNLRKEFSVGGHHVNVAVDDLHLRIFPDGITVMLGHNGAGKTTVINMMTGMLPPTAGDVRIYGKSILHDMQDIRRDIGFCPQHNILWDDLTCMEHLQYFARLKGFSGSEVDDEAMEMLARVDLTEKKDVLSCNLSGGQKRKLSVAIAFMGRARLVLLDEPTAGMDVAARRHTWDVLKDMAKGRTILLTTHYMDEADLLGSRITIMSKGSLHSYGTPMYLKNNIGTGYVMRTALNAAVSDATPILREVQRILPNASIRESKGQEIAISLPKADARRFPTAIRTMDSPEVKQRLNIASVSVSVSSLEDVFLSIAEHEEVEGKGAEQLAEEEKHHGAAFDALENVYLRLQKQQREAAQKGAHDGHDDEEMGRPNHHKALTMGFTGSFGRQLRGMFMKRVHHGRRDYCALCLQILAPLLCILVAMGLGEIQGPTPARVYWDNHDLYDSEDQIIATNNCPVINDYLDKDFVAVQEQFLPTTVEFSNYLLDTYNSNGDRERMVSFSCNDTFGNNVMFVNATGLATAPQSINQFYRAKVRAFEGNPSATITAAQWPFPFSERQQSQIDTISAILVALFILIPFTFVPSTYVAYVVRERECKSKHLQFVSGANYSAYWLANFLFDLISFCVTVLIAFILFAAFKQNWVIGDVDKAFGAIVLFLLYGLSAIGFAYLVSFLFDNHSNAQTVVMMVNFIVGFLLVLVMFFLREIDSTESTAEVLVFIFRIAPPFCLGDGLFSMVMADSLEPIDGKKSAFSTDVAGWNMLYMGILSVAFLGLTMFIDHPSRAKRREMLSFKSNQSAPAIAHEDEDVLAERKAVESGSRPTDVVQVQGLRKVFDLGAGKKKVAVQNITFGVKPGEVFGFLGTNGAGKTTTMSMLTTEIIPTCGHGRIGGYDIVQDSDMTRRLIGYCPQFDAIMDLLTPAEHLRLFSALRGIDSHTTDEVIDSLIDSCALTKYRDIPAGRLSGGNKRKLSVAMSLIGGPSIVFLDEPSAGMDPHARRQLWDVIIFVAKHSSVVLTTHHLEEVDVLAHRVGIMDQGLMKCLGTLEHLKHKFGSGFELTIQTAQGAQQSVMDFVKRTYPAAVLVEARQQRILYTLPFESTDLASLFETIQRATDDKSVGIVDYTVQQTSLEQVFMRISELSGDDQNHGSHNGNNGSSNATNAPNTEGDDAETRQASDVYASVFNRSLNQQPQQQPQQQQQQQHHQQQRM